MKISAQNPQDGKKSTNSNISIGDFLDVAEASGTELSGSSDSACASGTTLDMLQVMCRQESR